MSLFLSVRTFTVGQHLSNLMEENRRRKMMKIRIGNGKISQANGASERTPHPTLSPSEGEREIFFRCFIPGRRSQSLACPGLVWDAPLGLPFWAAAAPPEGRIMITIKIRNGFAAGAFAPVSDGSIAVNHGKLR
jgi:hypothetical protein